jgi:cyanophycinase-like exopeptidase
MGRCIYPHHPRYVIVEDGLPLSGCRMGRIVTILMLASLAARPAFAACDEDSIDTVSEDGETIILSSGAVYQVDVSDQVDVASWLPGEDVLVCNDAVIVNKDEDAERIGVTPLQ